MFIPIQWAINKFKAGDQGNPRPGRWPDTAGTAADFPVREFLSALVFFVVSSAVVAYFFADQIRDFWPLGVPLPAVTADLSSSSRR